MRAPRLATRVTVLLLVLAVVAMWTWSRTAARRARTTWDRPVAVAVVLLGDAPPASAASLRAALDAVAARLGEERARHVPGAAGPAVEVEVLGPVGPARLPPVAPPGDGWWARAGHALETWRATRAADEAAGLDPATADVRVYLVARGGAARFAEGIGEAGGEVAVVRAGLGDGGLLAATAVLHEVLHALGATDKYDAAGHALEPDGLVEPERAPRYPQARAELMVGEVPLAPGAGRLPATAAELGVGPATAAEIGWLAPRRAGP